MKGKLKSDIWYDRNGMKRNCDKYQAMIMRKQLDDNPVFMCDNTIIPIRTMIAPLRIKADDKLEYLKFEAHITKPYKKPIAVLQRMKKMLSLETRKKISHYNNCQTETWHLTTRLQKN